MGIYFLIFTLELLYDISLFWSLYILVIYVFGYEVKSEKQFRNIVMLGSPAMAVMTTIEWIFSRAVMFFSNNWGMLLLIIYVAFVLKEKWWKSIAAALSCAEIVYSFQTITTSIIGGALYEYLGDSLKAYCLLIENIFLACVMVVAGILAEKVRKQKISLTGILSIVFVSRVLIYAIDMLEPLGLNDNRTMPTQIEENSRNLYYTYSFMVYFAALMVMIFLFVFLIHDTKTSYYQRMSIVNENYLEAQKKHYDELVRSNMNIRRMRHDMRGHIFCMNELLNRKDYDELAKYIHALSEEFAQSEIRVRVGNDIADAIIAEKMQQAEKKKIKIEVDGDMSGIKIAAIDLCTILANILDNAIEAVEKYEKPEVVRIIHLYFQKTENFLLITQTNPVDEKLKIVDNVIDTNKTDKEMHGFGIANIKSAVEKYDGVCELSCEQKETNEKNEMNGKSETGVKKETNEISVKSEIAERNETSEKTKQVKTNETSVKNEICEKNEASVKKDINEKNETGVKKDINEKNETNIKNEIKSKNKKNEINQKEKTRYEFKIEIMIPRVEERGETF